MNRQRLAAWDARGYGFVVTTRIWRGIREKKGPIRRGDGTVCRNARPRACSRSVGALFGAKVPPLRLAQAAAVGRPKWPTSADHRGLTPQGSDAADFSAASNAPVRDATPHGAIP